MLTSSDLYGPVDDTGPIPPIDPTPIIPNQHLSDVFAEVRRRLHSAYQRNKKYYDQKHRNQEFERMKTPDTDIDKLYFDLVFSRHKVESRILRILVQFINRQKQLPEPGDVGDVNSMYLRLLENGFID
ncbi:hypothetical protein CBL_05030 [Carabus blaptoides fortunei]